jgi:hypothetical protein
MPMEIFTKILYKGIVGYHTSSADCGGEHIRQGVLKKRISLTQSKLQVTPGDFFCSGG